MDVLEMEVSLVERKLDVLRFIRDKFVDTKEYHEEYVLD